MPFHNLIASSNSLACLPIHHSVLYITKNNQLYTIDEFKSLKTISYKTDELEFIDKFSVAVNTCQQFSL